MKRVSGRCTPHARGATRAWGALLGIGLALISAESVVAAKPDPLESPKALPGIYAATFGRSGADFLIVQYWSKGRLFRSETIVAGHPLVTIVNGAHYYMYDTLTRKGYVVTRSAGTQAADAKRGRPFANDLDNLLEDGGELVRSEDLKGVPTDVYRVTDRFGKRTLWVTRDALKLPLRLERFNRQSGASSRLNWMDWLPGLVIPDSFFEPDARIELQRFESYEAFVAQLREGPVPPAPPLYNYLIHLQEAPER